MGPLRRVADRFWFLPAVLCVAAVVLSEALISLDGRLEGRVGPSWAQALFYRIGESGTRDILGTIAASSLGVAGTTFSITMAVLALTSSSYGPRLVRNFMADRGNQAVLGVFLATFLYSLLVLRAVGSAAGGPTSGEAFVPHLAVNTAIVLAVANVVAMVYFIHHISDSIQIATLSSGVREELLAVVDRMYPETSGAHPSQAEGLPTPVPADGTTLHGERHGYVQSVEHDDLVALAHRADLVAVLHIRPGQYVLPGTPVLTLCPGVRVTESTERSALSAIQIANARSPHQDIDFSVQQLIELAVRALSPGTNDPVTAINALDDLSSGLARLVARDMPPSVRVDTSGTPRLHLTVPEPLTLVTSVVDHMRWYATSSPGVMHATLVFLERVGTGAHSAELRSALVRQVALLRDAFDSAGHHVHDTDDFGAHAAQVVARITGTAAPSATPG
jgi:uncharacterized membrane protein